MLSRGELAVCHCDYITATTTTLTRVIPSRGSAGVSAVTSLGDDVFVARYDSQQVEIYNAETLTLRRRLTVPGLVLCPRGLAACPENSCLYASEHEQNRVHRVDLSGSNAAKDWSVARGPAGLSVNGGHNLIVACHEDNKVQEYTTYGSLVREICLEAGVVRPWHAVQLSTGDYAVSQNTSPGVVSVVGVDGKVLRGHGQSPTSSVGPMMHPSSLAVTRNDDVVVADASNNRILLIKSSSGSVNELALSYDGRIDWPRALCLDESRGRLYVGECDGEHRVLMFHDIHL